MNKTIIICYIIAVSQLVLGALYLFAPAFFIAWQGLSPIAPDAGYPLAMLAGRFLIYGAGMIAIAHDPVKYRLWLDGMIAIQAIDLLAGAYYTGAGIVALENAALPMLDAAIFIGLMLWVRRGLSGPLAATA
jgi:hypothetical protein